ncbi:MAG: polysaccharide pyruvyl transferase family protein [Luteolibacter sp.]
MISLPPALDLGEFFSGFHGKEIVYCPNPGNAGDSLIAAATLQAFEQHEVSVELVRPGDTVARGRLVFFGGGGNLVPEYTDCSGFLERNHAQAERLVLLPHSVRGHEALLGELGPNVDLILREPTSYAHCLKFAPHARVHLAHDMAFRMDVDALRLRPLASGATFRLDMLKSRRRRVVHRLFRWQKLCQWFAPWKLKRLDAFRTDLESTGKIQLQPGNLDLSTILMYGVTDRESIWLAARHLADFIDAYQEVHTDRLHVSIIASLLGKGVFFHPNSYYKNEAVYRYSMQDRFPLTTWCGDDAC